MCACVLLFAACTVSEHTVSSIPPIAWLSVSNRTGDIFFPVPRYLRHSSHERISLRRMRLSAVGNECSKGKRKSPRPFSTFLEEHLTLPALYLSSYATIPLLHIENTENVMTSPWGLDGCSPLSENTLNSWRLLSHILVTRLWSQTVERHRNDVLCSPSLYLSLSLTNTYTWPAFTVFK